MSALFCLVFVVDALTTLSRLGAVAQWLEWVVRQFDSHSRHSKIGERLLEECQSLPRLRCAWARHHTPMRPGRSSVRVWVYECVTLCMWMCVFNRCQPGWVKSRGEISCISYSVYMTINLILILNQSAPVTENRPVKVWGTHLGFQVEIKAWVYETTVGALKLIFQEGCTRDIWTPSAS